MGTFDWLLSHPGKHMYEGTVRSTDGVRHNVIFHKASFETQGGTVAGLVGAIVNITERKEVERAREESEAKTRSILDNIGVGVSLVSPEMEILELNHRMREWFPAIDPGQRPVCYRAFNDPPGEEVCEYCPTVKTLQDGLVHEATTQTRQAGGLRNYRIVSSPQRGWRGYSSCGDARDERPLSGQATAFSQPESQVSVHVGVHGKRHRPPCYSG